MYSYYVKKDLRYSIARIFFFFFFFQSLGVFGLCQILSFVNYLGANMSKDNFNLLFKTIALIVAAIVALGIGVLTLSPWTTRCWIPVSQKQQAYNRFSLRASSKSPK